MKWFSRLGLMMLVVGAGFIGSAQAADETRTFQLKNRLRVEYDDNIYETSDDKSDSVKIIEEVELLLNMNLERSFVGLRYRPTYVWWADREPDDDDLHHDFDLVLSHNFTPRFSLSLKDTFRIAEQPEQIDRGTVLRENDDYVYNVADALAVYAVTPETRLDVGGRYTTLRFDREEQAETDDYDIYAVGPTIRHDLTSETVVMGEYRFENITYDGPERGSDSHYVGGGFEHIFSPSLLGNIRAGAQMKQFETDGLDDATEPYFDASVTFLPSPATRVTAGAGYSMFESDVYPFASQNRTLAYLSMAHDLTARISLYVAGSYAMSEYNADEAIENTIVVDANDDDSAEEVAVFDGDETIAQFSTRASYKVNRSNWLELGWQYLNLDSDYRTDYDRNRLELGWRTQL